MYLTELIHEFLFDCKVRELSDLTIHNYEKQLNNFRHFVRENFQVIEFEDLKPYHVKQYISSLQDRECKPAYINDLLKAVKCLCSYAQQEGYSEEVLTKRVKNVKQPKVLIHTFSSKEILRMIKYFNERSAIAFRSQQYDQKPLSAEAVRGFFAQFGRAGKNLCETTRKNRQKIHALVFLFPPA